MLEEILRRLGDAVLSRESAHGDDILVLKAEALHPALEMLRDDPAFGFDFLADLFGMDYAPREPRFGVVYQLVSLPRRRRLRVRVPLAAEAPEVESVADLWPAAEWLEREAFDLFGIRFRNHPDLRRILLPDNYDGHPLRKDYPLQGRGERGAFPKYSTETPLGDLVDQALEGRERLA